MSILILTKEISGTATDVIVRKSAMEYETVLRNTRHVRISEEEELAIIRPTHKLQT